MTVHSIVAGTCGVVEDQIRFSKDFANTAIGMDYNRSTSVWSQYLQFKCDSSPPCPPTPPLIPMTLISDSHPFTSSPPLPSSSIPNSHYSSADHVASLRFSRGCIWELCKFLPPYILNCCHNLTTRRHVFQLHCK
nr:hypothetical protein HmN_000366100 [Hymenolepis microstoma]